MYIQQLFESVGRTLYHATLRKNVASILEHGLWTSVGEFTKDAYDEYPEEEMRQLIFAADKDRIGKCISAIVGWLHLEKIDATFENIVRYGAILVLREGEKRFAHRDEFADDEGHPLQVEPGDYYTDRSVYVDGVLTGKKLQAFLLRNQDSMIQYIDHSSGTGQNILIKRLIDILGKDQAATIRAKVMTMDEPTIKRANKAVAPDKPGREFSAARIMGLPLEQQAA